MSKNKFPIQFFDKGMTLTKHLVKLGQSMRMWALAQVDYRQFEGSSDW